jgi:4-hydroxybenzoate polyprenyltransferase
VTSTGEGQTFAHRGSRLIAFANFVKLPHTLFALPFALVGVILASYRRPLRMPQVGWVILAFTAARFAAMAFNRIADRDIDARNPRTAMREIPTGALSVGEAWVSVVIASAVFVCSAAMLNRLCLWLSPLALAWVLFYSYTKRFTRWAHVALGAGLAIAPVGGYLAVAGDWSHPWWMLVALAVGVMTWVAGFDVLYSLADADFDRANGLHSIPAMLGEASAVKLARVSHAMTVVALALVGVATHAGVFYVLGVVVAAAILMYEHSLVKPGDLSKLDTAFFAMNGMMSIMFFFFVLIERVRPLIALGLRGGGAP